MTTVAPCRCYHCHETVLTADKFQLVIQGKPETFCCPACLSITETIINSGLGNYYEQRENAAPIPSNGSFTIWDNPSLQENFVTITPTIDRHHDSIINTQLNPDHSTDIATSKLYLEGMHCSACAWLIEKTLLRNKEIISASIDYSQERLDIEWHIEKMPLSAVMDAIAHIGYKPHPYQEDQIKNIQYKSEQRMLKRLGILGLLMMQIGMLSIGLYAGNLFGISDEYRNLLKTFALLLSLPVLFYGALPFITRAIINLENRQLSMDVNVAIAIIGLFSSSTYSVLYKQGDIYFDSVAMLCFFILLARYIEHKSRVRLRGNNSLLPRFAHKIYQQKTQDIPLANIQLADIIRVKQGETVPADGQVIQGDSTVSESMLTGEAKPVNKTLGDFVLAGSQNHDGEIDIQVTRANSDSLVRNIERFLQQPNHQKPQSMTLTNRLSHHFSWIIIGLSLFSYFIWLWLDNPDAYWIALSVLVVSCPCALSLAAPTALSAIQAKLRTQGILIQNASTVEKLINISHIVVDKTGTLTAGEFKISQLQNLSMLDENRILHIASSLEASSRHPISQAFIASNNIAKNTKIELHLGIEGEIDNIQYRIGSLDFCQQWHSTLIQPQLQTKHTVHIATQYQWVGLCNEQEFIAWFLLEDALRPGARETIAALQAKPLTFCMLSGDQTEQVNKTADFLNIEERHAKLTSFDKLSILQNIQTSHPHTLMIGDGINDAPVLSESYIGATFSNACDWVKNSSDIIILDKSLSSLQDLFTASQHYHKILKQNFAWAIGYNVIAIPFAMLGYVTPWMAALGMSASSLIVVLNSYRLSKVS